MKMYAQLGLFLTFYRALWTPWKAFRQEGVC